MVAESEGSQLQMEQVQRTGSRGGLGGNAPAYPVDWLMKEEVMKHGLGGVRGGFPLAKVAGKRAGLGASAP